MEFAGRNAAQQMQTWIQDEFAYITHKRDWGISENKGESDKSFESMSLMGGIRRIGTFNWRISLNFFQFNEEAKLKVTIIGLDGDAGQWFE